MLCLGLVWGLGDRDRGDIELGECWGDLSRGGEGMDSGLRDGTDCQTLRDIATDTEI